MPWQIITNKDEIDVGTYLYVRIYYEKNVLIDVQGYPIGRLREGTILYLYDGLKSINTAQINRIFMIDALPWDKRAVGIVDYVELTFTDGKKWFCTEPQASDPFSGVVLEHCYYEWVIRAQL